MSNNIDRLGNILAQRMGQTARAVQPMGLELGRITNASLTLVTDGLRRDIHRGSYSTVNGLQLYAGDRVVVAWVDREPVVLGRLTSS